MTDAGENRNETIGLASPPWYNEGVADYFGTYFQKQGKVILGDLSLLRYRCGYEHVRLPESLE